MSAVIKRRDVLKGGSALLVSFTLQPIWGRGAPASPGKPVVVSLVESFLAIDARGAVTVYSGKVDLGTGVRTALAQMAADELDIPLSSVTIVQGDTALTPD